MRRQRIKKIGLLLLACIIIAIFSYVVGGEIGVKLTEENTSAYTGIISRVDITHVDGQAHLYINTYGRRTTLLLPFGINNNISETDMDSLFVGQTITYRIENNKEINWDKTEHVFIVALRVGETDILTLEQYRSILSEGEMIFKQFCIGFLLVLVVFFLWLLCSVIQYNKRKRRIIRGQGDGSPVSSEKE